MSNTNRVGLIPVDALSHLDPSKHHTAQGNESRTRKVESSGARSFPHTGGPIFAALKGNVEHPTVLKSEHILSKDVASRFATWTISLACLPTFLWLTSMPLQRVPIRTSGLVTSCQFCRRILSLKSTPPDSRTIFRSGKPTARVQTFQGAV